MAATGHTDVPTAVTIDDRLSYAARGLYAYLLTQPATVIDPVWLAAESPDDTPGSIRALVSELEDAGLVANRRVVVAR